MQTRLALLFVLTLSACSREGTKVSSETANTGTDSATPSPEVTASTTSGTASSTTTDTETGAPTDTGAVPTATVISEYDNMDFMPADLVIAVGDTVEFVMHRSHNAIEVSQETYESRGRTPLDGGFAVDYGTTALITFTEAGVHYYVCQPHASVDMVGTITVEP